MKVKYLLLIICIFGSSVINAQNTFQKLFDKYDKEDDVMIVSISKSMINLIPSNINLENLNIQNLLPKLETLLIISSSNIYTKQDMSDDFKALIEKDKNYEELMRVREKKSSISFNVKKKGEIITELVLLVDEEKNFVAVQILGNFTVEDIQNISRNIR
jgi:hypothetical protein